MGGRRRSKNRDSRQRILDYVHEHPGASRSEIREALDLAWGTVGHHLNRLSRHGAVQLTRIGRTLHVSPADEANPHGTAILVAPLARRVLEEIAAEDEPIGASAVARSTGLTARRVTTQIQYLAQAGLLESDDSYHARFQLTGEGSAALDLIGDRIGPGSRTGEEEASSHETGISRK